MLPLERYAWSTAKRVRQVDNKYAAPRFGNPWIPLGCQQAKLPRGEARGQRVCSLTEWLIGLVEFIVQLIENERIHLSSKGDVDSTDCPLWQPRNFLKEMLLRVLSSVQEYRVAMVMVLSEQLFRYVFQSMTK